MRSGDAESQKIAVVEVVDVVERAVILRATSSVTNGDTHSLARQLATFLSATLTSSLSSRASRNKPTVNPPICLRTRVFLRRREEAK